MSEKEITEIELNRKIQEKIIKIICNKEFEKIYNKNPKMFVEIFIKSLTLLIVKQLVVIEFTEKEITEYFTKVIASDLFEKTIESYANIRKQENIPVMGEKDGKEV